MLGRGFKLPLDIPETDRSFTAGPAAGILSRSILSGMPVRHKVLALMFALTVVTYLDRVCIAATAGAMSAELGLTSYNFV